MENDKVIWSGPGALDPDNLSYIRLLLKFYSAKCNKLEEENKILNKRKCDIIQSLEDRFNLEVYGNKLQKRIDAQCKHIQNLTAVVHMYKRYSKYSEAYIRDGLMPMTYESWLKVQRDEGDDI